MIVVDASVAVKWLLPEAGSQSARQLLISNKRMFAPALIRLEVTGAILRAWRNKRLSTAMAQLACGEWEQMLVTNVISQIPNDELFSEAVRIAFASSHALADCLYLAVAQAMNAEMVTADVTLYERGKNLHDHLSLLAHDDKVQRQLKQ